MKRVRRFLWEEEEALSHKWGTRHRRPGRRRGVYMQAGWRERERETLLSVGQWMREDEEPNHQRPLWLLLWVWDPTPGVGEEQEGGSGVPYHPAGRPGLHHRVRRNRFILLLFRDCLEGTTGRSECRECLRCVACFNLQWHNQMQVDFSEWPSKYQPLEWSNSDVLILHCVTMKKHYWLIKHWDILFDFWRVLPSLLPGSVDTANQTKKKSNDGVSDVK